MKRIKKVFTSSHQVFNLWAAQSQSDARQGGNRTRSFFEGVSCYSYGMHYELGRIVEYNGVKLAIINNTGYSHTTSKHMHQAYQSASMLMPVLSATTFDVFQALVENQDALINRFMCQLGRLSFWKDAKAMDEYDRKYVNAFNALAIKLGHSELVLKVNQGLIDVIQEHIQSRVLRQEELERIKLKGVKVVKFEKDIEKLLDAA